MTTANKYHERNDTKHEYEIDSGGPMIYAGMTERMAIHKAIERARLMCVEQVRIYHTYPSPGPVRRYVGWVGPDGIMHRSR
jgi:hypothetical protein